MICFSGGKQESVWFVMRTNDVGTTPIRYYETQSEAARGAKKYMDAHGWDLDESVTVRL